MYYEHDVVVKMRINTLADEVTPKNVEEIFKSGHWDYEVHNTQFISPAEIVAQLVHEIKRDGLSKYAYANGYKVDLVFEILDNLRTRLEDFQEMYEEAV